MDDRKPLWDDVAAGERLISDGDYQGALRCLLPHTETASYYYWLHFHIGRAYAGLRDRPAASTYFLRAIETEYPYPFSAIYELVRIGMEVGDFSRTDLLGRVDDLPGQIDGRDAASDQKRLYYFQITVLRALVALHAREYAAADRWLEEAYRFSLIFNESLFKYDWAVADLKEYRATGLSLPYLDYLHFLFVEAPFDISVSYRAELDKLGPGTQVVEIGAMDGVRFDPLHAHIVSKKWRAVVVEPIPDMFRLLERNYAGCPWVACANVAISEQSGTLTLYRIDPDKAAAQGRGDWVLGITSATMNQELTYMKDIVQAQIVDALSFADFAQRWRIGRIDVLQIDTEGYDWKILKQIDLDQWCPALIHVEIAHLQPSVRVEVIKHLAAAGYRLNSDGMNITAVADYRSRSRSLPKAGERFG